MKLDKIVFFTSSNTLSTNDCFKRLKSISAAPSLPLTVKWLESTASDNSGKGTLINNYFCSVYSCSSSFEPVDSESPVVPMLCLDDVNFTVEGLQKPLALLPVSAKASTDGILFVLFTLFMSFVSLRYLPQP